jgi:hypothetical protein
VNYFWLRKFVVIAFCDLIVVGRFGGISGFQEIRRADAGCDFYVGQGSAGQLAAAENK